MLSTASKIASSFECSEDQVPKRLYRVRYSGNQSLKARAKAAFKSESHFKRAVELHLTWCSTVRTPFVSLFADERHAATWAQHLLDHGYHDVVLVEIDASRLHSLFCVKDLVLTQGVRTTVPEHLYEDEFLVLGKIAKRSVLDSTIISHDTVTEGESASSDSSEWTDSVCNERHSSSTTILDLPESTSMGLSMVSLANRMAEALYHLGDSVTWSPTSAPRGQLVLLQDCVEAGGAFLVHHFTSLFLKAGHRVCFVASSNSPEHYAAVGRKLGVNFAVCERKKQLEVLDWTRVGNGNEEEGWKSLFEKITSFASQNERENGEYSGVSIVLDDVSALKWQFGEAAVLDFVRCCKTLTHDKNGAANVVLLSHADTDLPTSRPLSPALADMATVVLVTKPLSTGYSKDIHGTLAVYQQNQGLVGSLLHEEPPVMSYKILESTIKCFHSGGEALQWN